jgi:hypothetical protein
MNERARAARKPAALGEALATFQNLSALACFTCGSA